MKESKYNKGITETDKTDLEILRLLTPAHKKGLREELAYFLQDYHLEDCERQLTIILTAIISTKYELMQDNVRSNCVFFIGRLNCLLKVLLPPNPVRKKAILKNTTTSKNGIKKKK